MSTKWITFFPILNFKNKDLNLPTKWEANLSKSLNMPSQYYLNHLVKLRLTFTLKLKNPNQLLKQVLQEMNSMTRKTCNNSKSHSKSKITYFKTK